MFWKENYDYTLIDKNMTDEILEKFLEENNSSLQIVDNPTRWCAFAQHYATYHNFDVIQATSFSYMISLFMTGMGISASTEMYFKEEQMEYDLIDALNQIKSEELPEEDQVKKMFKHIFELYKNDISKYEYATERLSFKLTPSQMMKFQNIDGKTNKEKFLNLLDKI